MRHKYDSEQGPRHDLDHRTTRFCAPAQGMIYSGTKFRIGAVVVKLCQWTLSQWTPRSRTEDRGRGLLHKSRPIGVHEGVSQAHTRHVGLEWSVWLSSPQMRLRRSEARSGHPSCPGDRTDRRVSQVPDIDQWNRTALNSNWPTLDLSQRRTMSKNKDPVSGDHRMPQYSAHFIGSEGQITQRIALAC